MKTDYPQSFIVTRHFNGNQDVGAEIDRKDFRIYPSFKEAIAYIERSWENDIEDEMITVEIPLSWPEEFTGERMIIDQGAHTDGIRCAWIITKQKAVTSKI